MSARWLLALLVGAGCNAAAPTTTLDVTALYGKYCAVCHGPNGTPDATMVARMNVRDLNAPETRARLTPELVEHQIRKGSENKLMPGFEGAIGDAQIKALATWVASPAFPAAPK